MPVHVRYVFEVFRSPSVSIRGTRNAAQRNVKSTAERRGSDPSLERMVNEYEYHVGFAAIGKSSPAVGDGPEAPY